MRRRVFLVAAAVCLIAQGAFAIPDCHCADRDTAPPCHQSSRAPERGACCSDPESAPDACTTAMQASCCGAGAAPAAETAAVQLSDHVGGELVSDIVDQSPLAWAAPDPQRLAPLAAPPPRGAPTWILNSTLRN